MTETPVSLAARVAMRNANRLKIGLFGANCSSGRAVTRVAERWSGSWPDNLALARLAEEAGLDFLLPVARWKGYGGGDTDYQGTTLETLTWATGLLGATRRMTVFGTLHAPLINPILAAKQMVTADHVGEGRFGLNVVVGWNEDEFEMFGVAQREHEARYAYGAEWLNAVKAIWSEAADFDIDGQFLRHRNVRGKPKPYGGARPMIMNAGGSPAGRAFALKHCDAFFTVQHARQTPEEIARGVAAVQSEARGYGREIDVYTVGVVTCRPTTRAAEEYHRHAIVEHADWGAVDAILAKRGVTPASVGADEFERRRLHQANGMGGLPIVGAPDVVAEQLADLSRGGLRGIGVSFVNYLAELPYFAAEVLPRLVRLGVREPR